MFRQTTMKLHKKNNNNNENNDRIAAKYCFRAVSHLRSIKSRRIIGTFTGFDKTPDIAISVQKACEAHIASKLGDPCECMEAQLLLHEECPVECGDITFVFYSE